MEGKINPHPDKDGKSTPASKCLELFNNWYRYSFNNITKTKMYGACVNSSN
jgi:hypothetical protein